jgi:hypothetical protein
MERFLSTFFYREEAFLIDEVTAMDAEARTIVARMDTDRFLPVARYQRERPGHPRHVSGPELILATADLGCLHAWFFHGCRWAEGWVGFGYRIHRADFRELARIGDPLELRSRETRARIAPRRIALRFEFEFRQGGRVVYRGDQSAMFLRAADGR